MGARVTLASAMLSVRSDNGVKSVVESIFSLISTSAAEMARDQTNSYHCDTRNLFINIPCISMSLVYIRHVILKSSSSPCINFNLPCN